MKYETTKVLPGEEKAAQLSVKNENYSVAYNLKHDIISIYGEDFAIELHGKEFQDFTEILYAFAMELTMYITEMRKQLLEKQEEVKARTVGELAAEVEEALKL
jgi:hypothetical protein